jgi:hypothetical protein
MSASKVTDPQAAEFFAQVLKAQKSGCECDACIYLRRMGDELISTLDKSAKVKVTTRK